MHRTETVPSGDVTIFFRLFGDEDRNATPLIILHGSSYYDSADWIDIAERLARFRPVAAIDMRGYGNSGWSPSKDYSHDAQLQDIEAVLDHLGWQSAAFLGHSRGGAYATLFCARRPRRAERLITVDYCPGIGTRGGGPVLRERTVGQRAKVFASMEEAVEKGMSRHVDLSPGSKDLVRLQEIVRPVEGGFVVALRDPDYVNPIPVTAGDDWTPEVPVAVDMWDEMAKVSVPVLAFRAKKSKQFSAEALERFRSEFPDFEFVEVDTGHDVVAEAPDTLVERSIVFLSGADEVDLRS